MCPEAKPPFSRIRIKNKSTHVYSYTLNSCPKQWNTLKDKMMVCNSKLFWFPYLPCQKKHASCCIVSCIANGILLLSPRPVLPSSIYPLDTQFANWSSGIKRCVNFLQPIFYRECDPKTEIITNGIPPTKIHATGVLSQQLMGIF